MRRPKQMGQERQDISHIDLRLKLTSEHLLKRRTWSFTHASEQRASLVIFLLVSHLASTTAVPSVLAVLSPTGQTGRCPCPVCLAVLSVPSVPSCFRLTCPVGLFGVHRGLTKSRPHDRTRPHSPNCTVVWSEHAVTTAEL